MPQGGRRFPLSCELLKHKIPISLAAVVVLVALRITIGWHFFYEGVWKIENAEKFSAKPFLTEAKGPFAPLFYAMVPDLDGRERLKIEQEKGQGPVVKGDCYLLAWNDLRQEVVEKYGLTEKQQKQAKDLYDQYARQLRVYLADNQEDLLAHFGSLDRFEAQKAAGNTGGDFQQKRLWDRQQELRKEVNVWLTAIDDMGASFQGELRRLLDEDQRAMGPLPQPITFGGFLDFSVTWALTLIGLCLMVGFATRLAALGGAAFLVSVLMTQPPIPTIYPPAPEVVGHALVVDKNFVEMVALLVLAATAVGQWAGLDLFVYRYVGEPLLACLNKKSNKT